jgi:hypothetical protein
MPAKKEVAIAENLGIISFAIFWVNDYRVTGPGGTLGPADSLARRGKDG